MLADLVAAVRAGQREALVVRGEPGVGKTALLDYLAEHAQGCRVVRTAGMQSEIELAFAGLHQLLAPMLDRLEQSRSRNGAHSWWSPANAISISGSAPATRDAAAGCASRQVIQQR
jgi:AAA ATPase domain